MMSYWDAHTHPQFAAYDEDREAIMHRANEADVKMIAVGTTPETSREALRLAERYPERAWATVGMHPSHFNDEWFHDESELRLSEREVFDAEEFKRLAAHPKAVAVGECGLDYYRETQDTYHEARKKQKDGLVKQIAIAHEVKKPLMIHCRAAFPELIETLNNNHSLLLSEAGIIHFFTGSIEEAHKLLSLGFSFTFGGVITFTSDYDEIIRSLPIERILSETDAPYVAPVPYRGKRNEPSYVPEVVRRLAGLKGVSEDEMKTTIGASIKRIFGVS